RRTEVVGSVFWMRFAKPLGDQDLYWMANELASREAEELLGLGIYEQDVAALVDDDHRVRRRFEKVAEFLIRLLPLRHIAHGRGDHDAPSRLHRGEADFGWELRAIFAHPLQVEPRSHRTRVGIREVAGPLLRVAVPVALWNERLDGLSEELGPLVAEE